MRVDILANNRASFIKPMADGLARMLESCGAEARLHYDGLGQLNRPQSIVFSSLRSMVGSTMRFVSNRTNFRGFVDRLQGTDLIVVVSHVPTSFSPSVLPNVEALRRLFPEVPIVNYDLVYLPSLDSWSRAILRDDKTGLSFEDLKIFARGKFGMERYDWYLLASVGGYMPLREKEQPYSIIGLDLDDGSLYPAQQGEFRALLDFPQTRGKYPAFREIQLEALRLSGVKYESLHGQYTREELIAIFRRSSALLLSHTESFGLPICEAQACGNLIFAPDPHWTTAHWLSEEYHAQRPPACSPNFVFYENNPAALAERLKEAERSFSPERVRQTFLELQPRLFRGDRDELAKFLEKVRSGAIHPALHRTHRHIGRNVAA